MMKVIFNHDAAIDEYIAGVLLTTMPNVELSDIIITNGDCIAGPAMDAAYKIQHYINLPEIPLSLAQSRGWNQFPWSYREDSIHLNNIDCLKSIPTNPDWPVYPTTQPTNLSYEKVCQGAYPTNFTQPDYPDGNAALANTLQNALNNNEKVVLVVCCPLTLIRNVLEANPALEGAIEHLVWMGGAVNGDKGNLDPQTLPADVANPWAEWNVFWDPYSVAWVFEYTSFPITLFPLNVTDQAKVSVDFMEALKAQSATSSLSKLAYESYQLTLTQPFYRMWDVTTAAYLDRPDLYSAPVTQEMAIITDGYYQGTLIPKAGGRALQIVLEITNLNGFYQYVLNQLNRN